MGNMTQILSTMSQHTDFVLDSGAFVHWLAFEADVREAAYQGVEISRPDQKKGG